MDDLLSKIYDKVIFKEADSLILDEAYDNMVSKLLDTLGETIPEANVDKISDLIYEATYQARKDGFLLGTRFMTKLLAESLGKIENNL